MGYPLVFEVLDYAPATLTHREKLLLIVLADDANNQTRITYSSVQDPKILKRAHVSSSSQLYGALKGLIAKGALKKITHGQRNAMAKYVIMPLGPAQSPGNRDADESQGPGIQRSGSRNSTLRVPETGTPTVSTDSTLSNTSARKPASSKQREQQRPDVEAVCTHLADVLEATGSKRPTITAKWRDATRLLLDRDGITPEQAKTAIDWAHEDDFWQAHILTPMKLREKYDTLRRQATAKQRRGSYRPYADPENQDEYDGDIK